MYNKEGRIVLGPNGQTPASRLSSILQGNSDTFVDVAALVQGEMAQC
jgi:hypothetical protein